MPADSDQSQTVSVGGRLLKISNLDKVLYPQTGTTKGEVIAYYNEVAAVMLPHLNGRPVTRKRWVHGVGSADEPGPVFFQKNLDPRATPDWVHRFPISHHDREVHYPIVDDIAALVWLAQLAALEIHVPQWRFDPSGTPQNPDRLVLDLDPGPGVGLPECAQVAHWARDALAAIGLDLFPVTSGSKGIHLYAQLDGSHSSADASAIAKELARSLQKLHPDLVISEMSKQQRTGKVFIDWSQNNGNKTTISPYSLRGRMRPTVAVPRNWDEIDEDLEHLDLQQVLERIERVGDLIAPLAPDSTSGAGNSGGPGPDRLATYRSMRDPGRTPEPVPAGPPTAREGADEAPMFVIQEHHARRLHYDFRLEHDGVLVSWAVPKGVPTSTAKNHLAVQTEDHPIEYGSFAGIIPHAEYGGGEVIIFDTGTFRLEKWRDGREVIAVLTGTKDGGVGTECKIALIHTGGRGGQPENHWLMHLMSGSPAEPRPATEDELRALHQAAETDDTLVWHSDRDPADGASTGSASGTSASTSSANEHDASTSSASTHDASTSSASTHDASTSSASESDASTSSASGGGRGTSPEPVEGPPGTAGDHPGPETLEPVHPMLATPADDPHFSDPEEWSFEMKWDGVRAVCYLSGGAALIRSRRGLDVSDSYPEIVDALAGLDLTDAVLDGEIVALDENGRPSFSRLQDRINLSRPADVRRARRRTPVQLVIFDLMRLNGRSLVKRPYRERRAELEPLITGGRIQLPPSFDGDLDAAQTAAESLGMEGVVAKRLNSIYQAGSRGRTWIKIKNFRTQEVVIGGWRTGNGRRADTVGSLLIAVPDPVDGEEDRLRYVGRVGSGFADAELERLTGVFAPMARSQCPLADVPRLDARDAHWIDPVLVGEVRYAEWTGDRRLRFPVWRGWRQDKTAAEITVE